MEDTQNEQPQAPGPDDPEVKVTRIMQDGVAVLIEVQQGDETRVKRIPPWEALERAEAVRTIAKMKKDSYKYKDELKRDIKQAAQLESAARLCFEELERRGVAVKVDPKTGGAKVDF
jgi:hypothetical protein